MMDLVWQSPAIVIIAKCATVVLAWDLMGWGAAAFDGARLRAFARSCSRRLLTMWVTMKTQFSRERVIREPLRAAADRDEQQVVGQTAERAQTDENLFPIDADLVGSSRAHASWVRISIVLLAVLLAQFAGAQESSTAVVIGNRVKAAAGGANVRNATLATVLFTQEGGAHGTITSGPVFATAGGFTGNWWRINWDSQPPNQGSTQGWSAESVISLVPWKRITLYKYPYRDLVKTWPRSDVPKSR